MSKGVNSTNKFAAFDMTLERKGGAIPLFIAYFFALNRSCLYEFHFAKQDIKKYTSSI